MRAMSSKPKPSASAALPLGVMALMMLGRYCASRLLALPVSKPTGVAARANPALQRVTQAALLQFAQQVAHVAAVLLDKLADQLHGLALLAVAAEGGSGGVDNVV